MNPKERSQIVAEFRILKSLVHPNIVRYYDHVHVPQLNEVHLYMEYCGGGDLAGVIRACKASGDYVSENMVWQVFTQLALALYRCHYNDDPPPPGELFSDSDPLPQQSTTVILHRDIKPDNVFLDKFNTVKLGDFGLAKILDHEHVMMANTYVGTPYYMSPEVLLGKPFTPQSDIWSLGCVLYELCAKHPPFQAKTYLQLSKKIRDGVFSPIPNVYSATLNKTISACLNMNALQRPTTATLLRLDVMKLCRKEREVEAARRSVVTLQTQLQAERSALNRAINDEVERRVAAILHPNTPTATSTVISSSPPKPVATLASKKHPQPPSSPPAPRNVKGPRTIREDTRSPAPTAARGSPLKQYYDDMDTIPGMYTKLHLSPPQPLANAHTGRSTSPKYTGYPHTGVRHSPETGSSSSSESSSSVFSNSASEMSSDTFFNHQGLSPKSKGGFVRNIVGQRGFKY